ncbi:two-component system regulatory protein YycI [Pediococcus pentosaceus]|uniref:two-component system regulatory protein YycI n=2 Tax=Pediococcus pentosaceus TaxID=1255 RepID=UPI00237EFF7E|nr:two-component system regulatory protein YycI [Pediococcus pentosaceus]MDE3751013.1 two-component system regulatory protein YycI [Pediococcus pentosaceus]
MDFRRIEVIFIVVFAILNAYLFGSYWQYQLEAGTTSSSNSSENSTILKEMRNDQITYMPLSNKKMNGYYASATVDTSLKDNIKRLTDQSARVVDNYVESTLNEELTVDPKQPQKVLNTFVKNRYNIVYGSEYQYNPNLSTSVQVVYTQMIDGHPVYSKAGKLTFYVNASNEVTGYTQGHLVNEKQLREKNELISQTRAVTWLYQYNEIQNDSKVEWADLGYTNLLTTDNGVVYVPTWVIGIKSKSSTGIQVKRINAFSGVLIKKDHEVTTESSTQASGSTAASDDSSSVSSTETSESEATSASSDVSSTNSSTSSATTEAGVEATTSTSTTY